MQVRFISQTGDGIKSSAAHRSHRQSMPVKRFEVLRGLFERANVALAVLAEAASCGAPVPGPMSLRAAAAEGMDANGKKISSCAFSDPGQQEEERPRQERPGESQGWEGSFDTGWAANVPGLCHEEADATCAASAAMAQVAAYSSDLFPWPSQAILIQADASRDRVRI